MTMGFFCVLVCVCVIEMLKLPCKCVYDVEMHTCSCVKLIFNFFLCCMFLNKVCSLHVYVCIQNTPT